MNRIFIALTTLLLVTACGNYNNVKNAPSGENKFGETQLDFATIKREILDKQCIDCHDPKDKHVRYADYDFVRLNARFMLARIESNNMPKNRPPLNDDLKAMFREWVNAGTPETQEETPNKKPDEPAAPIGFAMIKERVLDPYNCTACHTQYNDYQTVYRNLDSISAQIFEDKMPFPKRKNRPVELVKAEEKQLLIDWVGQGAPEVAGNPVAVNKDPELKPNWISLRNQVFGPKCILCHNTFGNRGGGRKQSFDTHLQLRKWLERDPNLFKFDKQEEEAPGLFVDAMMRPPCNPDNPVTCLTSAMPFNNPNDDVQKDIERITDEEMAVIQEWIKQRLPYDEEDS